MHNSDSLFQNSISEKRDVAEKLLCYHIVNSKVDIIFWEMMHGEIRQGARLGYATDCNFIAIGCAIFQQIISFANL